MMYVAYIDPENGKTYVDSLKDFHEIRMHSEKRELFKVLENRYCVSKKQVKNFEDAIKKKTL